MPSGFRYTEAEIADAMEAVSRIGSKVKAAKSLGISRANLYRRLSHSNNAEDPTTTDIEYPDLPSSELSAEGLIQQACDRFNAHKAAKDARKWMEIKINTDKPIGVCFMGDPHVDNNGCNWPLLKRDIDLLRSTPGMYGVNIGDTTDNWIGRLVRLYQDAEMSKKQAWKLAKYLLKDADIKWLCILLGNHDAWGDGPFLIKANAPTMVPVEDWQSRFVIVFPNGKRVKIHASHDFPGSSIWNKMHGPQKAAMLMEEAHIYACGHKHEWGINEGENSARGFNYYLIRSRGYKYIDTYSDQLGHFPPQHGASVTAIIDPNSAGTGYIRCFPDLEEAANYLKYRRSLHDSSLNAGKSVNGI